MTALIPLQPVKAVSPRRLGTVAQVGIGVDGVPIFADAPSVLDRGPQLRGPGNQHQKPALIFSNSPTIFSRSAISMGACANTGVVTAPSPTSSNAS